MSIGDLLSMPRAEGLFRRAVLQSGAAHQSSRPPRRRGSGRRLAEMLGVPATREAIARVPVDRLLEAQARIDAEVLRAPDPARWGMEVVASTCRSTRSSTATSSRLRRSTGSPPAPPPMSTCW